MTRMQLGLIIAATIALPLILGCGGGGDPSPLTSITVSPDTFTARVGDQVYFTASGKYADNTERYVTRQVAWNSSAPGTATVSNLGLFSALTPGPVNISASLAGINSNVANVTVVPVPALPSASYMPLALNNQWSYTGTAVTTGIANTAQTTTLTVLVSGQVVRDGTVWYELIARGTTGAAPNHVYWRHDPEGLVRWDVNGTVPVKFLDAHPQVGMTWADPEDPAITFEVVSTTEQVIVPAGTYDNCVRVVETDTYWDPPDYKHAWYKAGVGLVQTRHYAGKDLVSEQRLKRVDWGL